MDELPKGTKVTSKMVRGVMRHIYEAPKNIKLTDLAWVKKVREFSDAAENAEGLERLGLVAHALFWVQLRGWYSFGEDKLEGKDRAAMREYSEEVAPHLFEDLEAEVRALVVSWQDFFDAIPEKPKKLPLYVAGVFSWIARISNELPPDLVDTLIKTLPRCLKPELWEDSDVWWMAADAGCRLMRDLLEQATPIHDAYIKLPEEVRYRIRSDAANYAKWCLTEDWLKDYGTKSKGGMGEPSSSPEVPMIGDSHQVMVRQFRWRGA